MKEFNLELAKSGKPVCTRDGRRVRILCFDKKCNDYPICALVEGRKGQEITMSYTLDGRHRKGYTDDADLMMTQEKHEGWVNIYKKDDNPEKPLSAIVFDSKESAKKHVQNISPSRIITAKIEWEE